MRALHLVFIAFVMPIFFDFISKEKNIQFFTASTSWQEYIKMDAINASSTTDEIHEYTINPS